MLLGKIPLLTIPPQNELCAPKPPPVSRLILPRQPVPTEDGHVRGVSKRLSSGYAETIGERKNMEDRMIIFGSFRSRDDEDYFAVFDGHNGDSTAQYCAGKLHFKLEEVLKKEDATWDPIKCFKEAFSSTNESLEHVRAAGGTTAVVALFKGEELYIANVGDSRAVLCKNRQAFRVTTDHKPDLPLERERIEKNGGWVAKGGITGTLTVSRALGDFSYVPFVTCEPDVFGPFPLFSENQFLIMACDGLWDVVSDEEAVTIALGAKDPEEAAVLLRDTAYRNNSKDNISVMVIFFPGYSSSESTLVPSAPIVEKSVEKERPTPEKHPRRTKSTRMTSKEPIAGVSSSSKNRKSSVGPAPKSQKEKTKSGEQTKVSQRKSSKRTGSQKTTPGTGSGIEGTMGVKLLLKEAPEGNTGKEEKEEKEEKEGKEGKDEKEGKEEKDEKDGKDGKKKGKASDPNGKTTKKKKTAEKEEKKE